MTEEKLKPCPFCRLVNWWELRQARKTAKKHKLDFTTSCRFRDQISRIGVGLKNGSGEIVLVPMRSGNIARYRVTSEPVSYIFEYTGQRNWSWSFQGYVTQNSKKCCLFCRQ